MKKYFLLLIVLSAVLTSRAEDYGYLTIVGLDGTKTSLTAVGLSLTFAGDKLIASNAYTDEAKTVPLSNLASINFSVDDETTGIGPIQTDDDISISHADAIYTLQGRQLPSGPVPAKGVYILKKGESTRKVQVR